MEGAELVSLLEVPSLWNRGIRVMSLRRFGSPQRQSLEGDLSDNEARKRAAWANAVKYSGIDILRIDCDGRLIALSEYGKRTAYGWEIDQVFPTFFGGLDESTHIRARHWHGVASTGGDLGLPLRKLGR